MSGALFIHGRNLRFVRWHGVMLPMVLLLVACSGSASRDDEDREEPEEVSVVPPPSDGGSEGSDTTDTPPDVSGGMDGANGLGRMIRELDRVIERADAFILRAGLGADAASSSQPLDVLEARLRSVRARLAEMRGGDTGRE